jgi:hypothetical protein
VLGKYRHNNQAAYPFVSFPHIRFMVSSFSRTWIQRGHLMSWRRLLDWVRPYNHKDSEAPRQRGVLFLRAVVLAVAVLFFICGYAWAKKTVVLVVDGEEATVQVFSATVGGVLEKRPTAPALYEIQAF